MMKRMRVQGPVDATTSLSLVFPPPSNLHLCHVMLLLCPFSLCDNSRQGDRIEEAPDTLMNVREEMTKCHGYYLGLGLGVSEAGFSGGQHTGA